MTELVDALRQELLAIETDLGEFEAESAKIQARVQRTLDKAEKVRALISLYADETAADDQRPAHTESTVSSASVDTFRHADPVSEQAPSPQQTGGGTFNSPILRRFGRGLPPVTG